MSLPPPGGLALDSRVPYRELRDPPLPAAIRELALATFAAQRRAVAGGAAGARSGAGPARDREGRGAGVPTLDVLAAPEAVSGAVSEARLARLLAEGQPVGGIVTRREIATAVPFNARRAGGVVWSAEVRTQRRRLDAALAGWVRPLFAPGIRLLLSPAGQWWYPPGTYFGWHTNHAYPGWRLYLSHAQEGGRSFFRFRDPDSGAVTTSVDGPWDLRLFEVRAERHFWHAIYSATDRFSVGWMVRPWSLRNAAAATAERLAARAGGLAR